MKKSGLMKVRTMAPVTRRGFNLGALAAASTAALGAGFGAGSARAASEVVFLGWQGYDEALFVGGFMEEQGIELATTYIGNNDEIVTKLRAGGIGTVDIVTPYMGYVPLLAGTGLVAPIDQSMVPNLADVMPLFKDDENLNLDGQLYGVPFTWGSAPMMYNPAAVPEAPGSWNDLFNAEYEGKVGMMDDPLGNIMLAARIVTDAASATMLTHEQLSASVDYMIKLKEKQVRMVAVSWGELSDALSRGDVVVTFSGWEAIKKFAADAGAVVEYTFPAEGTFAWLDSYCVATDAPNWETDHALCQPDHQRRGAGQDRHGVRAGHRQQPRRSTRWIPPRGRSTPTTIRQALPRRRRSTLSRRWRKTASTPPSTTGSTSGIGSRLAKPVTGCAAVSMQGAAAQ